MSTFFEHLYDKATSPVFMNGTLGEWFRTTRASITTLINIVLDRIKIDALEDHVGTVSIGDRTVTKLSFADYIDGLEGDEQELVNLVSRLDKTFALYGMVLRKPSQ